MDGNTMPAVGHLFFQNLKKDFSKSVAMLPSTDCRINTTGSSFGSSHKVKRKVKSNEFRLSQTGVLETITAGSPFQWFVAGDGAERSGYEQFCDRLDESGNRMRAAGYSTAEITEFWDKTATHIMVSTNSMETLELFVLEFRKIFEYVEATTLRNRAAGLFGSSNSLGLLKTISQQAARGLQLAWENHRQYGGLCLWSWEPNS
jgi:hypothetical protein